MNKLYFAALIGIASTLAALAQSPQPIVVPIQNPSFEQAVTLAADTCGPWSPTVPGWTVTSLAAGSGAGVFQPAVNPSACGEIAPAPDGKTVAYLFHSSISQNLGPASPVGVYTLKVSFADRFYWYAAQYSASLAVAGSYWSCSTSSYAMGDFQQITMVCPIQLAPTPGDLTLTITGNGTFQLLVDNASLTFTPQP